MKLSRTLLYRNPHFPPKCSITASISLLLLLPSSKRPAFSRSACIRSSSIRRASRRARPHRMISLGSRSANNHLQACSTTKEQAKSMTMLAVSLTLNYTRTSQCAPSTIEREVTYVCAHWLKWANHLAETSHP